MQGEKKQKLWCSRNGEPSQHYYRVKPADYEQLLEKSVHKNYKKTNRAAINNIIKADINIAKNLDLVDRINTTAERIFYYPQRP